MGLKATPQRAIVYRAMEELCHASAEEVIDMVQSQSPDITVSTVYRILGSFCENNLLSKIIHPNGKVYYDINIDEHSHIITLQQKLVDIDDPYIIEMIRQRVSEMVNEGEQIDKISVQIITSER